MARLLVMVLLGMLLILEVNGLTTQKTYVTFICYFTFFAAFGANREGKK